MAQRAWGFAERMDDTPIAASLFGTFLFMKFSRFIFFGAALRGEAFAEHASSGPLQEEEGIIH